MNILIPMAGAGSRFSAQGYTLHKPVITVTERRSGQSLPMVVAAVHDVPTLGSSDPLLFIIRDFHRTDGVTDIITAHYPQAQFITLDHLTEGQAVTCLLAKPMIDNDTPLLIAACDNGMDVDPALFAQLSSDADAIIFTFRHDEAVAANPKAYGWVRTDATNNATGVSVKVPISDTPTEDHAIVGTFWFRRGADFVAAAEAMIAAQDRINGEFYVDQACHYLIARGLRVKVLEVSRYLCWGTPKDYEQYEATLAYWRGFQAQERRLDALARHPVL